MLIGINWISPHTLPVVTELLQQGQADFCELMVDNFIHLPPEKIQAAVAHAPIALHIVASRFLEKTEAELITLANHLRPWIKALQPLYVSDHLAQFTIERRRLPFPIELEYEDDDAVKQRVMLWQALLDIPLLIENHASLTKSGKQQARFYRSLLTDTQTGLLFDFSNAYIAEHNQICPATDWDGLLQTTNHFHVAGARIDAETQLMVDTHDRPIANEVMQHMESYFSKGQHEHKTLVIEFDGNVDVTHWQNEIKRVRTL